MKTILIIAHNNLSNSFWSKYLDSDKFHVTIYRSTHPDSLRDLGLNYDVTIVDTYFSNKFLSNSKLTKLGRSYISLPNLGERYVLTPMQPDLKMLGVKYARFSQDFFDNLIDSDNLIISA